MPVDVLCAGLHIVQRHLAPVPSVDPAVDDESEPQGNEPDLEGFQQALSLVKRTIITWVTLLALMTIAGWLV